MSMLREVARLVISLPQTRARKVMLAALYSDSKVHDSSCPCCGFTGRFLPAGGVGPRPGGRCPQCDSFERHRLFKLALDQGFIKVAGRRVLHFAPEAAITRAVKDAGPAAYTTSNYEGEGDLHLNIEAIDLPDASYDMVICSHVLEHVDDRKALSEMRRILAPQGELIAMVPIVEGWESTYENGEITAEKDRESHFGRWDHVRYYGADFRDRVREAGFALDSYTAFGSDCAKYSLMRGEKIFRARKV